MQQYTIPEWQTWENVAIRMPLKESFEKQAKLVNRSVNNYLELILCELLKIEIPDGVGKKK